MASVPQLTRPREADPWADATLVRLGSGSAAIMKRSSDHNGCTARPGGHPASAPPAAPSSQAAAGYRFVCSVRRVDPAVSNIPAKLGHLRCAVPRARLARLATWRGMQEIVGPRMRCHGGGASQTCAGEYQERGARVEGAVCRSVAASWRFYCLLSPLPHGTSTFGRGSVHNCLRIWSSVLRRPTPGRREAGPHVNTRCFEVCLFRSAKLRASPLESAARCNEEGR